MNKKMSKRQRDIKTKLMAAVCMLLVSSIMMVSTTYAWFTLSTAPEVTGINTSVGANGNLEMALMPNDGLNTNELDFGIESDVGDSFGGQKSVQQSNTTWGNLVKLDEGYGLDQITLYPAELNMVTGSNKISTGTGILKTPKYGADGRVSELTAGTQTGVLTDGAFLPNDLAGVRAIGNASGLSERQVSFRNARGTMLDLASAVQTAATKSMTNNGKALANVVIKYADANESVKFEKTELASINTMITDLEAMMVQIDTAYKNAVMAIIASGNSTLTDDQVKILQAQFNQARSYDEFISALKTIDADGNGEYEYADSIDTLLETAGLVIEGEELGLVEKYKATATKIATAKTKMAALPEKNITWTQVTEVLSNLANPNEMLVNNKPKDQLDKQELINAVVGGQGITITIKTGGGAFADIADHCDNFTAKVNVGGISVQGMTIPDSMSATMKTNSSAFYLKAIYNTLTAPTSGTAGAMPITDFYGYIIDLAFRTNAAESKLLLQVDAADRIYDDNSNEDTMGHGSNMTFASVSPDFSNDAMKELMKSIKVIFFNPQTGDIYVEGYLDADNAEVTAEGLKADLLIKNAITTAHEITEITNTTTGEGSEQVTTTTKTVYYGTEENAAGVITRIYTDASGNNLFQTIYTPGAEGAEGTTAYHAWVPATAGDGEGTEAVEAHWATEATTNQNTINTWNSSKVKWTPNNDGAQIMDLSQNVAKALSVLVYLDGTSVTNADVAYSAQTSMTGNLNLQFASSANLTAMEYADLHTPGATEATTTPTETQG